MPLFRCASCGCVENTASANAWAFWCATPPRTPLCTECNPEIGKWHGLFPKESADEIFTGSDGQRYRYVANDCGGTMPGRVDAEGVDTPANGARAAAEAKRARRRARAKP